MIATVLAHIASIVAGYITGAIIYLVFGVINVAVAGVLVVLASIVLVKAGVAVEDVQRLNANTVAGFFFITGVLEGLVKILVAQIVFHLFDREMGWIMVLIFIAFQLVPFPSALGEKHRANMRSGSAGAILGLLTTWLALSH